MNRPVGFGASVTGGADGAVTTVTTAAQLEQAVSGTRRPAVVDAGRLNCTFIGCWWGEGCNERCPCVRFGKVHVVNCLYDGNDYTGISDKDVEKQPAKLKAENRLVSKPLKPSTHAFII